ncbi:hypothetical protein RGQ29_030937 [Quercus rubra]|uniref:Uncharacterized protein n=1 Tax=Quercus rubra TaxID=3512 RepID=A0AAN7EIV6_QUERU|nr:hypothetical protein RGQ29_030937 [Quercus rubra]
MAEICSSFPTTGSLYFWTAHLAGPRWGPFASWCCAWLETIGLISGIGAQASYNAYSAADGYFAPKSVFLCIYIILVIIWARAQLLCITRSSQFLNVISVWWQVIGGFVVIIGLPLISTSTQSAYVFTHFETSPEATGIHSKPYAIILSVLLSQYCLYGYDTAAHLTEETKGADRTGPMAILSSIGIISTFGWAYILALTFCIQDPAYLFDTNNETAGALVPAQIIYDVFNQRYHSGTGAIIILCIIWGTFFFCGLSVTTGAARVVYALSRDGGIPFSPIWTKLHPKYKNPTNAVVVTVGWVGSYAVPIFARLVMDEKHFTPGPFLGRASKPVCLISFIYISISVALAFILLWWFLDARKWFKGPVRNIDVQNGVH